jgi:hypothetical protein
METWDIWFKWWSAPARVHNVNSLGEAIAKVQAKFDVPLSELTKVVPVDGEEIRGVTAKRLMEALREMVNDEAFAELLATIGEEPSWLLKARAALAAEKEQERGN